MAQQTPVLKKYSVKFAALAVKAKNEELCPFYLLSSKNLWFDELASTLLIDDLLLMEHLLVESSKSNDLQMKRVSERQSDAQASGDALSTTWSSFPDM